MRKFSTSLNGYNKDEVNDFIIKYTREYESLLNKLKSKDQELTKYRNLENTLNKTILIAEDTSNQMKKLAKEEVQTILGTAKKDASRIVNEALIKYQEIENDAEELKRRVINFKRKFKQAIETEQEVINEISEKY